MGSCRVMSAEVNGHAVNPRWDGMSIGMHCAAVSTHLRQDSIGRKTSESIIQHQQALQPAPALSSSDLARPRSGHATSSLGNGSLGTQGQSYAFCPPQPTRRRLVDKTHPVRPPAAHDDLFVSSPSIAGPQLKHIQPVLRGQEEGNPQTVAAQDISRDMLA